MGQMSETVISGRGQMSGGGRGRNVLRRSDQSHSTRTGRIAGCNYRVGEELFESELSERNKLESVGSTDRQTHAVAMFVTDVTPAVDLR